jgi:hypothetical protein
MGDGTIVLVDGPTLFVINRASGKRRLILRLTDESDADADTDISASIEATDTDGGRVFLSIDTDSSVFETGRNGANRDQLTEVSLRTGESRVVVGGLTFPNEVVYFTPTGELLHCTGKTGLIVTHPTTGAQRLLATAQEVAIAEDVRCLKLDADADPARDRVFFYSFDTGRIVGTFSGVAP